MFVGTKRTLITCAACQRPIHAQDLVMRALHAIYHYTCFTCRQCHRLLQPGEHFVLRHGQLMCNHLACQAREPRDQSSFEPNSMSNPRSTESNSHDSSATGEPTTPHSFPFRPFEQSEELVLLSSSSVDKTVSPNESDYAKRDVSGSNLGQDVVAQMIVTSVCEQFAGFPKQTQMDEDNEIESGSPNRTSHSNGFPRLVSTNRFMCDLNINPLYRSGDLIEPENEIRTDSNTMNRLDLSSVPLPFPQSTSPTPGVYGLLAENDFTPTVIYPHLNRSPKMTPLPPGDVGSMNPNPLLSQIQNRLCPIRGMSQGGVCEDLAKLVSYSSFLPTTGVSPIPSSPRIGTANSLLKLIEPGTSMLYGPNGVITGHSIPGPGPLLLAQSAQKRNRKRRTGLHQTFDGVCVTSPNGYCVGLSQRQKRMRTSFKHHQLRAMKAYFNMNHNPDVKDLKVLTEKTGLSKRVLQVWFQNARAKYRRSLLRQDGPNSSNSTNVNSSNNNTNSNATTTTTTNNNNNNINLMSTTISVINTTTTASNITSNVTNITANGMTTSSTGSTSDLALLSNNSLSDCDSKSSHFDMTEVGSHLSPKSLYPHNHSFMTDEGTDSAMDLLAEIRRPQMTVKTDDSAGIYGLGLVASPPLPIGSALPSTFEVQRSRTPTTTFTFISSGCRQRDLCTLGSIHG
ncbi:unnamed protein product [Echinostoma caproni]|uniref:Homeobox domain-containing protein n=1 Tax=Echinostoma caproni TaxID=27848 RepID=A0A3P8GLB3_9TREM|nr:unnamed protein product [Echinostoma caproni]